MPIRPLNTLTFPEVIQLLNNPAFCEYLELAYDMYYLRERLRQRFVQFTTIGGEFAVRGPPAPFGGLVSLTA